MHRGHGYPSLSWAHKPDKVWGTTRQEKQGWELPYTRQWNHSRCSMLMCLVSMPSKICFSLQPITLLCWAKKTRGADKNNKKTCISFWVNSVSASHSALTVSKHLKAKFAKWFLLKPNDICETTWFLCCCLPFSSFQFQLYYWTLIIEEELDHDFMKKYKEGMIRMMPLRPPQGIQMGWKTLSLYLFQ